jgi:hypothetical protein
MDWDWEKKLNGYHTNQTMIPCRKSYGDWQLSSQESRVFYPPIWVNIQIYSWPMKQNTCHLIKLSSYLVPNRISKYSTTEWKYALDNGHWAKPVEEQQVAISQIWQRPITSLSGWHAPVESHIIKLPVSNSVCGQKVIHIHLLSKLWM